MTITMRESEYFLDKPRYTSMLPLSYVVPTFLPTPTTSVTARAGVPRISLDDKDLQARAQRFLNVLFWTAETFSGTGGMNDSDTLKVFMAPEFYFRRASDHEALAGKFMSSTSFGSYPEESRYELAEALYGAIQGSSLFKDWIIVAGTICSVLADSSRPQMNLLNTAIMLRGQRSSMDSSVPYILMEKHYISDIDGPHRSFHANRDPTTVYSFALNPDQRLDNLIFWDGMSVGLEVCLDHSKQVLKNAMNTLRRVLGPNASELDLQLITSCGMDISADSVSVRDGALVMLTDGMSHPSDFDEPEVQIGRYDAVANRVEMLDSTYFNFQELPTTTDYQVLDYGMGRYVALGRQQGVRVGTATLPLWLP
ncbi:hypothetical protein [Dyella mobilis]|uniref:Uncharacterized protein n=1 Tax=Dyella mobilis TaxID=1849582 RepID=A0ABS2KLD8_9GAMM|nr:hypothetical protein [Dyella mobilis]MBM7131228.1 hypothetical protein [Dyella mobilis]GLQ98835.1 hypothetical protein GCM10007863_32550 [Dyella mobilis]